MVVLYDAVLQAIITYHDINIAHIRSSGFSTVILSNPKGSLLNAVSAICWELHIPLILLRTCGLIGYMRIQIREHHVTAVSSDLYDLRIFNPFPELHVTYC